MAALSRRETKRSTQPINVLVVEDQNVLRFGLKLTLNSVRLFNIVGEAVDGPSAVNKAIELKPHVVLMDIGLPGFSGIEATRRIKAQIATRVMILSADDHDNSIFSALDAGADGYCKKEISREKLISAIEAVACGAGWLDEDIARRVLRAPAVCDTNMRPKGSPRDQFLTELAREMKSPLVGSNRVLEQLLAGSLGDLNESQSEVIAKLMEANGELLEMIHDLPAKWRKGVRSLSRTA